VLPMQMMMISKKKNKKSHIKLYSAALRGGAPLNCGCHMGAEEIALQMMMISRRQKRPYFWEGALTFPNCLEHYFYFSFITGSILGPCFDWSLGSSKESLLALIPFCFLEVSKRGVEKIPLEKTIIAKDMWGGCSRKFRKLLGRGLFHSSVFRV